MLPSTTEIKRQAPSALLAGLKVDSEHASREFAAKLLGQCKEYGLGLRDYLRLSVDPRLEASEDERRRYADVDGKRMLNGYEATLAYLNLPIRDDFDAGITLQAAADTFQTYPGTRIMFQPVLDDMDRWRYHQTTFESTDGMVAQKRTVPGAEMISLFVEDSATDYSTMVRAIAEGGRIPIHSIKTSEQMVRFYKFGLGYKMSYEFQRRASLDLLTPFVKSWPVKFGQGAKWSFCLTAAMMPLTGRDDDETDETQPHGGVQGEGGLGGVEGRQDAGGAGAVF